MDPVREKMAGCRRQLSAIVRAPTTDMKNFAVGSDARKGTALSQPCSVVAAPAIQATTSHQLASEKTTHGH